MVVKAVADLDGGNARSKLNGGVLNGVLTASTQLIATELRLDLPSTMTCYVYRSLTWIVVNDYCVITNCALRRVAVGVKAGYLQNKQVRLDHLDCKIELKVF